MVRAFALHKKTACIKPLIKDKTSACNLVTCIIKVRKGLGGEGQNQNKQQIRHCAFEQPTKQIPA